eukprot:347947-Chlamydomonas_euryale.AAC.18
MTHTKRLSGIRNTLMIVERMSSGTYCARNVIIVGQNTPMQPSNRQNATTWALPAKDSPPLSDSPSEEPAGTQPASACKRIDDSILAWWPKIKQHMHGEQTDAPAL